MLTRLVLAVGFLTRLPTPRVRHFREEDLAGSVAWFPLVGALVGAITALPLFLVDAGGSPLLAAAAAVALRTWVTGALHLDGLCDTADGLGAAHRDPARFLEVLKDPRTGVFGVVTVAVQLLLGVTLLAELVRLTDPAWLVGALALVGAWSRAGAVWLTRHLPALTAEGLADRFNWRLAAWTTWAWPALLLVPSVLWAPATLVAVPVTAGAWWFWRRRFGAVNGDGIGASTEVTETVILAALVWTAL